MFESLSEDWLSFFVVFLTVLPSGLFPLGFLTKFLDENLKEGDRCEGLNADEMLILKLILKKCG
jgi:hypothetical protein